MSTLLVWKEQLQKLYARYSVYIIKVLQFIMGLCVFGLVNDNVGFMKVASSLVCTVGLSAVCAFLPLVVMVIAATVLVLIHFYALSMPIALVSLAIFLIMYIFYFRFTPQKAWLVLLTPVAFALKVPFVIPVAFGLLGTPICVIPAASGTIAYYMIHFVKMSSSAYKGGGAKGLVDSLMAFTKQSLANKEMWVMVIAICVGILIVYAVRTRSFNHSWKIASASGIVAAVVIGAAGNIGLNLHLEYGPMAISGVAAIVAGLVLEFLFFSVNYSRTERMQFEDDEYYYYVKAVPKVGVSAPEMSVKHINERVEPSETGQLHPHPGNLNQKPSYQNYAQETAMMDSAEARQAKEHRPAKRKRPVPKPREQVKKVDHARATDEILLTRSLTKELGLENLEDELNK